MIKRGEIYYAFVKDSMDHCERINNRPVIVMSNDIGNEHSDVVTVIPLTTADKKSLPTHCKITSSRRPSTALCESIITIPKRCLKEKIGEVSWREMRELSKAVLVVVGII